MEHKRNNFIDAVPYSQRETDDLMLILRNDQYKGKGGYYQIFVDQKRVVSKTNDLDEFTIYRNFLRDDTKTVRIMLFEGTSGKSCKHTEHVFYFGSEYKDERTSQRQDHLSDASQEQFLNGNRDFSSREIELVERERERWTHTQTLKELEETKDKLREADETIESLEADLEDSRSREWNIGEIAGAIEGFVQRNPAIVSKGLSGLFGFGNGKQKSNMEPSPDDEASFTRKGETSSENPKVVHYIEILSSIEKHFGQEDTDLVMSILAHFSAKPDDMRKVASLLDINQ